MPPYTYEIGVEFHKYHMRITDLTENTNHNLLVVDVQPAYDSYRKYIMPQLAKYVNRYQNRIIFMFNGPSAGLTDDDETSTVDYLCYNGIKKSKLENAIFIDKEYAFLRGWMDSGVNDEDIVTVLQEMIRQHIHDSRDLDWDKLPDLREDLEGMDDCIYFPGFFNVRLLQQISPFYMVGGGREECLREIELLSRAYNIPYTLIPNLIYE